MDELAAFDASVMSALARYTTTPLLGQQGQDQTYRVMRAYANLARDPNFLLVLEDMQVRVLFQPGETPVHEGKRQMLLDLIQTIRTAVIRMTAPEG